MLRFALVGALSGALVVATSACGKSGGSSSAPTRTPASPAITETFSGTLPVGGSTFYFFSIAVYGTVNATLSDVAGQDVPSDVTLSVGIGTPSATSCNVNAPTNVSTAGTALVTATEDPGVYCVRVADVGNLPATARFTVLIAHP